MNIYRKYVPRYWLPFSVAILCVAGESGCDLLGPAFMAHIINDGIEKNALGQVYRWGLCMLAATAAGALFAVIRNIISSVVSQHFGADLRYDLFDKILHFSQQSVDRFEPGSLITRMTNDVNQVMNFVNSLMRIFFKAPLTCIGSMILASMLNLRLSLIIYAVILCVGLLLFISMKLSYPRYSMLQKSMDALNTRIDEYLTGIRLVKAFGTYRSEVDKFSSDNTDLYRKNVHAQIIITFFTPLLTLATGCGIILVLYTGSRMFTQGTIRPGEISAFVIYMGQILQSLLKITNVFNNFVRTSASSKRISEIFSAPSDFETADSICGPSGMGNSHVPSSSTATALSFSNVTFAYPEGSGKPALHDISFTVPQGGSLAVIGPTGSGKSTLAWLLIRLYDPDAGTITVHGQNIKGMDVHDLRRSIALVPQESMLFSGTARSNLVWGNSTADAETLTAALHTAGADFITERDKSLDMLLGSGGVNLSGGQKQRLSIARALIKGGQILVLDDATSALDAITESHVRKAILAQKTRMSVIFITQRCSTAMAADRIFVLENGECCGYGTHKELMQNCSIYRDIYDSQLGGIQYGTN